MTRPIVTRSAATPRRLRRVREPAGGGLAFGFLSLLGKLTSGSERLSRARARVRRN